MAKSTANRKTIVSNAARDLVRALEKRGFTCILVQDMAAFLQGSKVVPKDVKLVVLPQSVGIPVNNQLGRDLVEQQPSKFRVRQRKNKSDVLSYYDSSIAPPKKTFCDFELISVKYPPPPEYRPELTSRVDGLPVLSLLAIVVDKVNELLEQYDASSNKSDFIQRPPRKLCQTIRTLLPTSGHSICTPTDKSFRLEALDCFIRASALFPEFSSGLTTLIRACQNMKTIRLSRPDGFPVLDVAHFFRGIDLAFESRRELALPVSSMEVASPVSTASSLEPSEKAFSLPDSDATAVDEIKTEAQYRTEVTCLVAKKVVDILQNIGVETALFGSLACHLYGNERAPNDIDIITFPPPGRLMTAEWLKQAIYNGDPENFILEYGKNPNIAYRVLYYRVSDDLAPSNTFHKDKCKVDVLLPGTMNLPFLPSYNIKWRQGLPVVPFSLLLLQKLQGWDDHRRMPEPYKFEKHKVDASDVQSLLQLEHAVPLRFSKPWTNRNLFNEDFYDLSLKRIKEFSAIYPACADGWARLGFTV
ncbi:hypothetical protein JR316_0012810 [Psilocybe cubensis]|uniref:Uncharacterized protein n=2 Tax=Psilocybe cubensis TaxID=181762 RepID=A0A8H7XTX0_PSICU|nr:hypothetical protein JR316_0012810 [Psilocybe cubensis]KAH9474352.1 hypothetical protein JR316_0012810 [Psilocybe cubensis]